jgi:hypothetical protein
VEKGLDAMTADVKKFFSATFKVERIFPLIIFGKIN